MNLLAWLVKIVFFLVVVYFALKNTAPVTVQLTKAVQFDVPLVVVILCCFLLGIVLGLMALAPRVFGLKRQVVALSRKASPSAAAAEAADRLAGRVAAAARNAGAVGELGELDADTRLR
jgi:uncharacterized integral membrane protein